MNRIAWHEETAWLNEALTKGGAFVIAKDAAGKANPMTIGWAQVGVVWSVPVMTVLIRESRYTFECVKASETFIVSVPKPGELRQELAFCGSKSGRDFDKIAETGMALATAQEVDTPVIDACGLHYECEIIARSQQVHGDFGAHAGPVLETYYPEGDHHLVVFGRIVAAYTTKGDGDDG